MDCFILVHTILFYSSKFRRMEEGEKTNGVCFVYFSIASNILYPKMDFYLFPLIYLNAFCATFAVCERSFRTQISKKKRWKIGKRINISFLFLFLLVFLFRIAHKSTRKRERDRAKFTAALGIYWLLCFSFFFFLFSLPSLDPDFLYFLLTFIVRLPWHRLSSRSDRKQKQQQQKRQKRWKLNKKATKQMNEKFRLRVWVAFGRVWIKC